MVAVRAASGSVGLKAQIARIEKRIVDRQQLIRHYVAACRQDVWNSLTSPTVLLSAGGIGFVIGTLATRGSARPHNGPAAEQPAGKPLDGALKFIAMIRTFLPTLRFAAEWLFPPSEPSSSGKSAAIDTSVPL